MKSGVKIKAREHTSETVLDPVDAGVHWVRPLGIADSMFRHIAFLSVIKLLNMTFCL